MWWHSEWDWPRGCHSLVARVPVSPCPQHPSQWEAQGGGVHEARVPALACIGARTWGASSACTTSRGSREPSYGASHGFVSILRSNSTAPSAFRADTTSRSRAAACEAQKAGGAGDVGQDSCRRWHQRSGPAARLMEVSASKRAPCWPARSKWISAAPVSP